MFAFSGSQWEEVCNACGIWVSCPRGGVQRREAFEMLTVLLPGTHLFSFYCLDLTFFFPLTLMLPASQEKPFFF